MASEKEHLLGASPSFPYSSPMLSQTKAEESSASHSLFVNDPERVGASNGDSELPATQKWEIVIAYPNPAILDFVSPADREKQVKRDELVTSLKGVGLFVSQRESSDSKVIFLLVGASQAKLEEYAELFALELSLKEEFGGGHSAFTIDKKNLFKQQGKDGLFNKTERQRLIMLAIETDKDEGGAELDLPGMEYDGVVDKVYPLHENSKKRELIDGWVKSRNPFAPIPMDQLRKYFGEEVAFYIAWLSFYTKWLAYASVVGAITAIIGFVNINGENYWSNTVYSIFIGVWVTLFLEFWKRERNVRAWQWNMLDFENEEGLRPGFQGEEKVGAYSKGIFIPLSAEEVYGVSAPKPIKSFPESTTRSRMAIGLSLIVTMCFVVGISSFAVLTFRILVQNKSNDMYASVVGGIGNAVVIMIMNKVYRIIAVKLNEWENHRTQTIYTDNLLFKIFLFQFVNSYTSMYYIAFFKRSAHLWGDSHLADTCGGDVPSESTIGCANQLYMQLLIILGTNIAVGQAQEVLIPLIWAKAKMVWFQKTTNLEEQDIPKYEREYQLNQFEGMVDEYGEMVIQFGYLTLFASSIPIAPVLAVINNVVEMRTDTFKWLTSYNKPFYRGADDIGGWYTILQVLGVISVITNCLLLIFSFPTLRNLFALNLYHVLWTVVILEHLIFLVKYVVSTVVPDVPKKIRKVLAKQYYIQQQLIKKFERKHVGSVPRRRSSVYLKKDIDEVENYENTHN